jgi:hypothetical protein
VVFHPATIIAAINSAIKIPGMPYSTKGTFRRAAISTNDPKKNNPNATAAFNFYFVFPRLDLCHFINKILGRPIFSFCVGEPHIVPVDIEKRRLLFSSELDYLPYKQRVVSCYYGLIKFAINVTYAAAYNGAASFSNVIIQILEPPGFSLEREFFSNGLLVLCKNVHAISIGLFEKPCRGALVPNGDQH